MTDKKDIPESESIKNQMNILSIAEGFFQSSILFALLKLNIFERIGEGNKTAAELAGELDAKPATLTRLLNGGVVVKLLKSKDGVEYSLHPACKSILLPGAGENYLGNWLRNLDFFATALSGLDASVLQSGPSVDPANHLGSDKEQTYEFIMAMHNYSSLRGRELARYLDTSGCKTLLDIGCGPGTYTFYLGLENPELEIFLLDLPEVLDVAREIQSRYDLKNKIHYIPQDVEVQKEIPGSYDMVLVSNTLHMLGERSSRDLIQRLYGPVNQGGSLVIQAQYLKDHRMGGRWPVFLDLIQLCITSEGKNHSVKETKQWLEEAGFSNIKHCSMSLLNTNSFLRGYKA